MKEKSTVLLSAALIACLVAGCGVGSGNPKEMERPQKGEAVGMAGKQVRDLTVAEEVEVDRAEEKLVEKCMERQGHRYWPAPVASIAERKAGAYVVDDVDWARRYGYGRPFDIAAEEARRSHPSVTYPNALPEQEHIRYSRALDGDFDDVISVELPSGGTTRTPRDGCYAEARERLYGDYPTWFRVKKTVTGLTPLYVPRILRDERLVTAVKAWSRCMDESGNPFSSPDEIRQKRDSLVKGMNASQAQSAEVKLAVAEAECARKTSLGETARSLEGEYREKTLRDYSEEFATYQQMRMTALPRARNFESR
ncbi:hypothetical protein [Streptomyces himalayensis]|uniref:Lipoprotein n=1 Tax=Streptomyces himalayensis subsp. himalayensis TaxID=2756131 RepID=A0A7W0DMW2_9ACTN|nr:hypothetical protein [Streptomyces himalayensis]MBA2947935.1 hypothetical protein [Streptomyces himalayensis subsp. himalayensis]